jgi:multicomponent Na+:H+ antiporter subunit F
VSTLLSVSIVAAVCLLGVALILSLVRVFGGPTTSDRVVAVDMISYIAIGFASVLALATGQAVLLDAAAVLAVAAFIGTLALARHVERTQGSDAPTDGGAS